MTKFNSILMVAVATISLSACAQGDQDMGYLGSRDDIIVTNAGATAEQVAQNTAQAEVVNAKVAQIETVKETITDMEVKEAVDHAAEVAMDVEPMETVTMKSTAPTTVAETTAPAAPSVTGDVPPNARPGECYAKVLIPAITETLTERIQVSEEQKVLDRIIPARYETKTERIKVKEARQYWKSGHGPITKVNEVTGEILCLVEEPAEYKTVEKRILIEEEKPQYKIIPAQFDTITKKNIIKAERWEWRRILCETNLSTNAVASIQRALAKKGYNIVIDGRLGNETMRAINSYQLKNGLASRGITYETLDHLGVVLAGA